VGREDAGGPGRVRSLPVCPTSPTAEPICPVPAVWPHAARRDMVIICRAPCAGFHRLPLGVPRRPVTRTSPRGYYPSSKEPSRG
jgi:hypothetical protein